MFFAFDYRSLLVREEQKVNYDYYEISFDGKANIFPLDKLDFTQLIKFGDAKYKLRIAKSFISIYIVYLL